MTLEENLGYFFFDKSHLRRALTHRSYALEQSTGANDTLMLDQDAYSLLGSAILDAVLTELLIRDGCVTQPAIVTRKSALKQTETLAQMSLTVGAGYVLKLGTAEKQQRVYDQPDVLAETLEAVIGAIYFDGGFSAARRAVQQLFQAEFQVEE